MNVLKIKETCLYVSDLQKSEDFYHGKLGFPIIGKVEGRHIFFRAGSSVLLCFIAEKTRQDTNLPPHYGSGHLHLAFEVSPQEYQLWKEKIQQAGITIEHEQAWKDDLHSFYFRDPDGHLLEIVPTGIWE
ncbi:glyoxalase [Rhodocytophaga rosea]|uniref:Glyoxalase n=1 Tax=Rhodocytophaga rosea TaxID=2704465 RepID=A0A6C0GK43_9BACT|nr:VOC family protein [Rhodocytophaga rosea]QHT68329.1 glyoxalase [Rhodocytophaga rosea]